MAVLEDTMAAYDGSSFTVPSDGRYEFAFKTYVTPGSIDTGATPFRVGVQFQDVTNNETIANDYTPVSDGITTPLHIPPTTERLDAGTQIELQAGEGSGSGVEFGGGRSSTYLEIERVE